MLVQEKMRKKVVRENLQLLQRFLEERGKVRVENISDWYDWFQYRKANASQL